MITIALSPEVAGHIRHKFLNQIKCKLLAGAVLFSLCVAPSWGQGPQSMNLCVMSLNVWSADAQTAKLAEIIQAGQADIIGLQEMDSTADGQALATALGNFRFFFQGHRGNGILSRYPLVGTSETTLA
jgi:endonuclease/exonuclease/phosphatase (EEP) superfamily protein YafD